MALVLASGSPSEAGNASPSKPIETAAQAGNGENPAAQVDGTALTDPNLGVVDCNGPTVRLNYDEDVFEKNPIRSFMYFVPLISPVPIRREICAENYQQVGVVSYHRKAASRSFSVSCEFQMSGAGFCRYAFEPAGMIALRMEESKKHKGEPLSNLLDYIHFEGEGFGRIRIKGTIDGATHTVTEVELEFNERGRRSPVTVGLYDLKAKDGEYCYENRSGQIVARVNSLTFKRSENPRMSITVASISKRPSGNGPIGHLKAAIANLFLKPAKIDPLGNDTLLNFGLALFHQEPTFTFPRAVHMKEITVLASDSEEE